jgi:hypothetical protein
MILLGILAVTLALVAVILAIKLRGGIRITMVVLLCLTLAVASIILFSARHLIFPSSEKYTPLAQFPVSKMHKGARWNANFEHTFRGRYEVGFTVKNLSMDPVVRYEVDLVIEVRMYSENVIHFSRRSNVNITPFWGTEEKGFVFVTYDVPHEMPIGQLIHFEVELIETGSHFVEKYGAENLFVRKASDK